MLLLSLPICLGAKQLLTLWLGIVPEYTVIFLQLVIIQSLFCVFDTSFYRALYAKGRLKENALISPTLGFVQFPIVYVLFRWGFSPVALSWASLIMYAIVGMVVKPILIIRIVDYKWREIGSVFLSCFKVVACSLPIPFFLYCKLDDNSVISFVGVVLTSVVSVLLSTWLVGMDETMKENIIQYIKTKKNICEKS